MSAQRRTDPRRRRTLRPVGPAVQELVDTLTGGGETVEIRLSPRLAAAIAHSDARQRASPDGSRSDPAYQVAARTVTVDRATAQQWSSQAWRAVGEGLVTPAEAQALSDQLAPRGAA